MYFTRYFRYLRNPYPHNDPYPQFHYMRIQSPLMYICHILVYERIDQNVLRHITLTV